MNNITKVSVLLAVVGAGAFALQSGDRVDAMTHFIGASSQVNAGSATSTSSLSATSIRSAVRYDDEYLTTVEPLVLAGGAVPAISVETASGSFQAAKDDQPRPEQEREERTARSKMSGPVAALAMAGGKTPTEIIVSYAEHPELMEDERIADLGGEIVRHYEVLELLAIRIPADALIDLAIEDSVDHLSLDKVVVTTSTASKAAANTPAYPSANTAFDGQGIGVAVLDSGVTDHSDFSGSITQFSFLGGLNPAPVFSGGVLDSTQTELPGDGYGHGTHVAGIIAGDGYNSSGSYSGPAGGVDIYSLQVLDESGHGQMSDVMAALDWLIRFGPSLDIRVANLSLGMPVTESNTTDPLVLAVEAVWDSGIVVAVAAGNYGREGYFSTTSPGNSRKVITVGSLTDNSTGDNFADDYVSTYSSRGPSVVDHVVKPDLVAPGNRLVAAAPETSTLATLLPANTVACTVSNNCKDDYMELSGTSMATPMVSAAAALMLQKDPTLTPATIKARLMRSARKLSESPVVAGAGLLDIDAALNETGVLVGDALSPLMEHDAANGGTLIQDTASLWGGDIWGSGYLWTDGVEANGYLWTDGGVNANGYLWTDGSVFANGYLWTDGGVAAFGYLWTDGVEANGYLWTDGVAANGYLWTDGTNALSLFDLHSDNPAINDDQPTPE